MPERGEQFRAVIAALQHAGDLALTPSAERLESAWEALSSSRPLWTRPATELEAEQMRREIQRVRALAEQAKRIFGAMVQLSCAEDAAPANYGPNGMLSFRNSKGEFLLHG
jgi:hypothetical protein